MLVAGQQLGRQLLQFGLFGAAFQQAPQLGIATLRLVHFLFGLLFFRPLRELLDDRLTLPPAWRIALPVLILAFISMLYEFVEWAAAEYFGGGLGMAYLGTQGDVWDAHKDMALALLGSLLAPFMDRRALRLSPTSPLTPRTSHAG